MSPPPKLSSILELLDVELKTERSSAREAATRVDASSLKCVCVCDAAQFWILVYCVAYFFGERVF
jgi:hypothetical protein